MPRRQRARRRRKHFWGHDVNSETPKYNGLSKRQRMDIMRAELELERSSFESHWKDLSDFILPRRSRFQVTDTNRGEKRNRNIYDGTATMAARTLASGMMSGITSPARPWFKLATPDPDLNEFGRVKDWLHLVSQRMQSVLSRTNLYTAFPTLYGDLGTFGTGCMIQEESFQTVTRFRTFPIGKYSIACDFEGRVNVFFREFRMTVRNLVEEFGKRRADGSYDWSIFSQPVKDAWDNSRYETWIDVAHCIAPNPEYDPNKPLSKHKKYASCYYERGCADANGQHRPITPPAHDVFLRESGYDRFPILAPRWEVGAEEVYGTNCPGMTALGDVRQLQLGEKRSLQAIEKMVNPPMQGPSSLRNVKASIMPGDVTYYDTPTGRDGFRPIHEIQPKIQELEGKQSQVRERISRAYFEDLFLMFAQSDRRDITATEILERKEEKLLALGTVYTQLNTDLLDPLVDNTFEIMNLQGWFPPPPEELQGMDLKVEYISVMAQAQKLVAIGGIERFTGYIERIAAFQPTVLDKVDFDQSADEYGEALGVSPRIIRTDEQVAELRAARAEAEQASQRAEQIAQGAQAAKNLSGATLEDDNALSRLLSSANQGAVA